MANRRTFLQTAFGLGAGLFAPTRLLAATTRPEPPHSFNVPVVTTDIGDLPYTLDAGVKVFHLIAEVIQQKIAPGKTIALWGFNGSAPGPTIQVNQGDRVRVLFENHLPEPTSMHWHGFEDQIQYDGQPGISQDAVPPGGRFTYEFTIHQAGTFFYHSHMGMQQMTGLLGAFIMHPREPNQPHCDKDFLFHLQEYAVLPSSTVPNTMNMEYNWLLLNGKAGPATTPLIVRLGDRVRIRFVNLGMDHHPMHMHGHSFHTTGTEAGRIQPTAWWPGNTVLVGVAQARDIEFVANNPGDWMIHCHLPHHMMNEMSSNVGRMTRSPGQPSGADMNTGMGMLTGTPGAPLGEDYGTSLGRGMGLGSDSDRATTNGPLGPPKTPAGSMPGMNMADAEPIVAANANNVPNFPQDAYMEGPMMSMDASVERPENLGLRPGWSQYMQGMMTFVRVLPPEKYDEVIAAMQSAHRPNDPYASILQAQPPTGNPAANPAPNPKTKSKTSPGPAKAPAAKMNMPGMGKMSMLLALAMLLPALPKAQAQQAMPGMTMPMPTGPAPNPATNPTGITHNTQILQEPEDPTHVTGTDQPAPNLLEGISARPTLTLQSFLDTAQRSSPTLAQARDLAQRAAAEARQAALYPNPTIGYQGEQIRGGSYAGGEQGAYIGQTIPLGGKLGLRRDVFTREREAQASALDEQSLRLTNDIAQAFYTALTAQAELGLRQHLLTLAADAVATVHQLANVGQADAPDILETEVESEQSKIDFVTAQRDFIAAFHILAARAGQPTLPLSPLAGDLTAPPDIDPTRQLATLLAQSPTLKRLQQQVAIAEARLKAAQHESIPDLELKAGEQFNNEHLGVSNKPAGPQTFASAGITLPLWNRNQGNIEAARADLDRARQQVRAAELTFQAAAAPLAQHYLAARFAADRYKTQLIPRAQRAHALYLAKYQAMSQAYPQVLVSQRTLIDLQLKYLAALHEVWSNATALQNFTPNDTP